MTIFLSFLQGKPGHPIPAYGFWEYYIKQGIAEAGHVWTECKEVDWAQGLVPQDKQSLEIWKAAAWERTLRQLRNEPVDLFLSYLYPHQVDMTAVAEIRRMGIPVVNFFCDNVREFRKIPEVYGAFDLNWVPEHAALAMYRRAGIAYLHAPMPMWVSPEQRGLQEERIPQVTFIGSKDILRHLLLEAVVGSERSIPFGVYGAGWLAGEGKQDEAPAKDPGYGMLQKIIHQGRTILDQGVTAYMRKIRQRNLSPEISVTLSAFLKGKPDFAEYIRLTKESYITLGINRYPSFRYPLDKPSTYSRLRDIEAPMLGACYLTEWAEGLEEMYEVGKEIELYRTPEELVGKAKELFANGARRKEMRMKGQLRALQEHSIGHTLNAINAKLKG